MKKEKNLFFFSPSRNKEGGVGRGFRKRKRKKKRDVEATSYLQFFSGEGREKS